MPRQKHHESITSRATGDLSSLTKLELESIIANEQLSTLLSPTELELILHTWYMVLLYFALFCSILQFLTNWTPRNSDHRLQCIQNSAARIVSRRNRHEHITPVLENLHWLPVQQRIMFKVVLFVFKCLNGLAPPYLAELINVKENSCSCQLQSDSCLQEKKTNNKFGDRAFSICGPVLWNQLPKCMKEINSLEEFKKELKTHLFKEAFG